MNIVHFCFCIVLKLNRGDVRFICLEAQILAEKQIIFKVFFIVQIGHRPKPQNQIAPRAKRGLIKKNRAAL